MEYTKNYHLSQWAETDRIMMQDFNRMCADIDSGIHEAQTTADSGKGTAEALTPRVAAVREMYLNGEISALLGQGYSNGGSGLALLLPAVGGITVYGVNYALLDNNGAGDYPSIHGTGSFLWTGLRTLTLETFTKGQSQYRLYGIKG